MNYRKVQICLDKGYTISIADISAASVSSRLLERLPPIRLDVLAARAVRGQIIAVSGNAIYEVMVLLESGEVPAEVSNLLN